MKIYELTEKAKEDLTFKNWRKICGAGKEFQNGGCGLSQHAANFVTKGTGLPPKLWETWKLGAIIKHSPLAEKEIARFAYEQMGRTDLSVIK